MALRLVKASWAYRDRIVDMLEEWHATGEKIIPYAIRKADFHDYALWMESLEVRVPLPGFVPDSTFFCLDDERDRIVGAVNIRHRLNEALLRDGGHIGDGVRPSDRGRGVGTRMIALALEECRRLGIHRVLMVCDRDNPASARTIEKNGGVLENEIDVDGTVCRRYWIDLTSPARSIL